MQIHTVTGAGGVKLHVREFGDPRGQPLVLIHGWSQSHLCWIRQYESALADEFRIVAYDLRGHGQSDAPSGAEHYTDTRLWADDLAAVLAALELQRPVVVGWSYGGLIIGMYVEHYSDRALGAANFVGAACLVAPDQIGTLVGDVLLQVMPKATSNDLGENIDGMRQFVSACFTKPLSRTDYEAALMWNICVKPEVRAAVLGVPRDTRAALQAMRIPTLITQGRDDRIVLPAMAELMRSHCPTAELSWYDGVGHGPFIEAPERFNAELAAFARRTRAN